jgi:hypothetical protein
MRRFVDLHTHSSASDGSLGPGELVRAAEAADLAAVALTDHDTTAGLMEALRAAADLTELHVVPGVEVSAKLRGAPAHILGLGIDPVSPALGALTERLREARRRRNPKILRRLGQLGVQISLEEVAAIAAAPRTGGDEGIISRVHIAEAMRRRGYVRSTDEAFAKYIGNDGPAYVDKERLRPAEVVSAVHEAGGLALLAHPVQLGFDDATLGRAVRALIRDGLDGLEVYHADHTPEQTRAYMALAKDLGLLISGGSDFHGPRRPQSVLGRPRVPRSILEGALERVVFGRGRPAPGAG